MPNSFIFRKLTFLALLLLSTAAALAQVDTAWVRRYNGPGNTGARAYAIAIDSSGNVYVTGESSDGIGIRSDYCTIKYYPNGDTAWMRRYNGLGDTNDVAHAIVIDRSGNCYVTGYSGGSGTFYDYATIKYDANGDTAWVRRYNGTGDTSDVGYAIAVDDSGYIYVTGSSCGSGTFYDYATIKYYPNGDTAWVRRYSGLGYSGDYANAIAVDNSGNVYVAGLTWSDTTYFDYLTIKYSPNGNTAWARKYSGPGSYWDYATAIAVDRFGNVYVTGYSYDSITSYDYTTIKYYPNGVAAWIRKYDGEASWDDWARAINVDNVGNVYITGLSIGIDTDYDYATVKYYPNGDTAWARRYNGPGNGWDEANAIIVDAFGNVYVTGYSYDSATRYDYATIKYYSDGDTAWIRRYNGLGNSNDYASAITVYGDNNVYVTGYSIGTEGSFNYATIKYVQTTEVKDQTGNRERPSEFTLSQNYPNPFNQSTKIEFTLPNSGLVSLDIYNLLGRRVRTLVSEHLSAGYKSVIWDGKDNSGKEVASGVYFYQMKVGDFSGAKKLVIIK